MVLRPLELARDVEREGQIAMDMFAQFAIQPGSGVVHDPAKPQPLVLALADRGTRNYHVVPADAFKPAMTRPMYPRRAGLPPAATPCGHVQDQTTVDSRPDRGHQSGTSNMMTVPRPPQSRHGRLRGGGRYTGRKAKGQEQNECVALSVYHLASSHGSFNRQVIPNCPLESKVAGTPFAGRSEQYAHLAGGCCRGWCLPSCRESRISHPRSPKMDPITGTIDSSKRLLDTARIRRSSHAGGSLDGE